MNILHLVEFYPPSIGGMQEVVRQISERLAGRGHRITVATSALPDRTTRRINGVDIVEFDISGNYVWGFSGDVEKYQNFLLESDFDLITCFAAQQWTTDLLLPLLDRVRGKKIFVPTGFPGLLSPSFNDYFAQMADWIVKFDANVFLSNDYRDIDFARRHGANRIVVIPNGAAMDEFLPEGGPNIREKLRIPPESFLVLNVSSHIKSKGHAETIAIFGKAKIKNAVLLIVGNQFGKGCSASCRRKKLWFNLSPWQKAHGKSLIIASLPRVETVSAFKTADLFLFPSKIECSPLVLFECMASKTPFLTSAAGNATEIIAWSQGGELLPTAGRRIDLKASAKLLEAMYHDKERRQRMAEVAYDAWLSRFTWESLAGEYEALYRQVLAE